MKTRTIAGLRSRLPYRHLLSESLLDLIVDDGFRVHELRWTCVLLHGVFFFCFYYVEWPALRRRPAFLSLNCGGSYMFRYPACVYLSFICYRIPLKLRLPLQVCMVCFGLQMDFVVDAYIADGSGWTNT